MQCQQELRRQKRWQDRHLLRERNPPREKRMISKKRSQPLQLESPSIQPTNKFRRAPILYPNDDAASISPAMQIRIGWKPRGSFSPRLDDRWIGLSSSPCEFGAEGALLFYQLIGD